jgi:hypothetical protein
LATGPVIHCPLRGTSVDNVLALLLGILHAIFTSRFFWFCVIGGFITRWISWIVRDAVKDAIRDLDLDERVREAVREALEESREETEGD